MCILHYRLQTRDGLDKRGVISSVYNLFFPECFGSNESHHHVFIACRVANDVWLSILEWVGVVVNFSVLLILITSYYLSLLCRRGQGKIVEFLFGYCRQSYLAN